MMNAVHNARIQLLANLLNTMAGSSFTVGVAAPIAASYFFSGGNLRLGVVILGACFWTGLGGMLHVGAQYLLAGLR